MKPEEFYALIAYLDKSRGSYGGTETFFKRFSQVNASNIDREGIYVLIDDMFASGGTAMKAGQIFKDSGAKRVEAWMSHAVTVPHQYDKANVRAGIDTVVCIDTVPQSLDLNIEYIHASAPLLASELYKAHEKLVHERDAA
jgi:phosphoribosylpyrophosphate synthetase